MNDIPTISLVCPVYNEEEGITEFYDRCTKALEAIEPAIAHELIFVDDGSADRSAEILRSFAAHDHRVRVIEFSRNFGHQIAITAGVDHAHGDAVVVLDTDLQDPPEVIGEMIEKWKEGYGVVYGQRNQRPGESKFKLWTARGFYRLINWLSDVHLPLDTGDFRLMDRQVVEVLRQLREENRYVRGLVSWVGFRQYALSYDRDARYAGETKYPLRKMLRFATDGITSFSDKPLRLATQAGLLFSLLSIVYLIGIGIWRIVDPASQAPGFASIIGVIILLGGMQLISVGILGQYIGRIYRETKERPLYVVAERVNLDGISGHVQHSMPSSERITV